MADTIQSGIKSNTKNYNDFGYFVTGIDVTQQNLDQFTPFIPGYARIFLYTPPIFMNKVFPEKTKNFKSYVETGYTRIDGIGDISVDFYDFEGGFARQKYSAVTMARDDTDTITVTVFEQSGSPIREYLDTWITGVRDIRSGVAHYHGAIESTGAAHVPYSEKNHTCEFIYYVSDPTMRDIEYACMFAHCFPTKVTKSHLNYDTGSHDGVAMDIEMRVTKYESKYINQIAKWYQAQERIKWNYIDFNPNITEKNVKDAYTLNLA